MFFNSAYFIVTDVGCLAAGAATVMLHRRGLSVHGSRSLVFLVCSLLTVPTVTIFWLPAGGLLLDVLLLVAMGALGVFLCYYSFSQELTSPSGQDLEPAGHNVLGPVVSTASLLRPLH